MAEKKYALMYLKGIIKELNTIDADYRTGSYSAMDMSDNITLAAEHIADKCIRDPESQQNFSGMSAKLVQELTIRQRMSENRYKEWYDKNHDMVGWLKIDGTNVDYPIRLSTLLR